MDTIEKKPSAIILSRMGSLIEFRRRFLGAHTSVRAHTHTHRRSLSHKVRIHSYVSYGYLGARRAYSRPGPRQERC